MPAPSAAAAAILDYRAHGCRKFKEHLHDHLANGYVFSTPNIFALFKAGALEASDFPHLVSRMTNHGITAWYVTYARGDLRILAAMIPFPLPYIAWRRHRNGREVLRVYPFDLFLRHAATLQRFNACRTASRRLHPPSSILHPRHV